MENRDYLNQISADVRPNKSLKDKVFSSRILMVVLIGLVALVVIMIVGAIIRGNVGGGTKQQAFALKLNLDNTAQIIQTYQPSLKSSGLRSNSASLYSILTNTSKDLTDYLQERYNYKEKDIDSGVLEEAELARDGLESELMSAKINGILDRTYAHKMTYEISELMTKEATIINATSNETLGNLLRTSYDSLENLYTSFSNFSETN